MDSGSLPLDSPMVQWRVGDVVDGGFEVREVIAEPTLVYRVHHDGWDVDLALRTPDPQLMSVPQRLADFLAAAAAWAEWGVHPNVVGCVFVRRVRGVLGVFSEWVDGDTLEAAINSGRLYDGAPDQVLARILDIAIQLTWGLDHVHRHGSALPDILPCHVVLRADGAVKLTGFTHGAGPAGHGSVSKWPRTVRDKCAAARPGAAVAGDGPDPVLPDAVGELSGLADELIGFYRQTTGLGYPRPHPTTVAQLTDGLNNQALSMLELGRREQAEQLWRHAVELDPRDLDAVYNYGLHRWRTGDITDADLVAELEGARAAQPGPHADRLLALVHLERCDTAAARELLADAVRAAPDDPDIAEAVAVADSHGDLGARILTGHTERVASVAVSADGLLAASGSRDGMRVWDVATGTGLHTLRGETEGVHSVGIAADGATAVSGSSGTVAVWDVASGPACAP